MKILPYLLLSAAAAAPLAAQNTTTNATQSPPASANDVIVIRGSGGSWSRVWAQSSTLDVVERQTLRDRDTREIRDILDTFSNVDVNDITEIASVPTFTVRGSAEDINIDAFGGTPGVAYYVDDIPALSVYGRNLPVYNLQSAEFYKGPHGFTHGAPGSAGLLRLESVLPGNQYQGDASYIYGSYNRQQVQGSLSGPIVKDQLAIGFSGHYQTRDGYVHNSVLDATYGDVEERSGRMQLRWTPVEELEVLLTLGIANNDNGGPNFTSNNGGDPYTVLQGVDGFQRADSNVQALRLTWNGDGYRIVSATSRQHVYERSFYDFGTFFGSNPFTLETAFGSYQVKEDAITQEVRIESNDPASPWQWNAGLFFGHRDNDTTGRFDYNNLFGFINGATVFPNDAEQETYALFGSATYTAWEQLELTAGVRLEMLESRRDSELSDPLFFFGGDAANSGSKTTAAASPLAAIAWLWSPAHKTWFRFSRGFQPGDIASASHLQIGANMEYGPQTSTHYELGHKASFYEGRLILNPSLYYTDYENYQAYIDLGVPPTTISAVFNAESAYAMGAELQIFAEPFPGLTLQSNLGLQEARYDAFERDGRDYNDNDIPNIPAYSAKNRITYRYNVCDEHTLMASFECNVTGNYEFDQDNNGSQDAYAICNARIGYEWKHAAVYLFGANLFQADYLPSGYSSLPAGTYRGTPGAPQTFGVECRTQF